VSAYISAAATSRIFVKFDISELLPKSVEKNPDFIKIEKKHRVQRREYLLVCDSGMYTSKIERNSL
jgi:hypothetical protein